MTRSYYVSYQYVTNTGSIGVGCCHVRLDGPLTYEQIITAKKQIETENDFKSAQITFIREIDPS